MSEAVKDGDSVRVHYTGRFEDDQVFDSSAGREPLEFTVGSGQVIPGFNDALLGMAVGDKKSVTLQPEDAYGECDPERVIEYPRENLPEDIEPEVDMMLQFMSPEGHPIPVRVSEVLDDVIKLDANPPMAGKVLIFDLELVEIVA